MRDTILLAAVLATVGSVSARAEETTGVAACDAFIAAYRRCVASGSIPSNVRPALNDGIASLIANFKEAASNEYGRRGIAGTCLTVHQSTRRSLTETFKCDFPDADTTLAQVPPTAPITPPAERRARTAAPSSAEEQLAAKEQAYIAVHNDLVSSQPMSKIVADFKRSNERVLQLGDKMGANGWFSFGVNDFDRPIEMLEAAIALPGALPGIDQTAADLLGKLKAVNPVVKALDQYQTTREFKEDGYKFAQQQAPIFIARMTEADAAEDRFSDALDERDMARDSAKIARLPDGSPPRLLLVTTMDARRAVKHLQALAPNDKGATLAEKMAALSADNRALAAALNGLSPKPNSYCISYSKTIDTLIGAGRDIARDLKGGSEWQRSSERFITSYNNSIEEAAKCQRNEARLAAN